MYGPGRLVDGPLPFSSRRLNRARAAFRSQSMTMLVPRGFSRRRLNRRIRSGAGRRFAFGQAEVLSASGRHAQPVAAQEVVPVEIRGVRRGAGSVAAGRADSGANCCTARAMSYAEERVRVPRPTLRKAGRSAHSCVPKGSALGPRAELLGAQLPRRRRPGVGAISPDPITAAKIAKLPRRGSDLTP